MYTINDNIKYGMSFYWIGLCEVEGYPRTLRTRTSITISIAAAAKLAKPRSTMNCEKTLCQ